jgi:AraC-like DNA-binding protein/quercetin dioxygenase-like cupin family protein
MSERVMSEHSRWTRVHALPGGHHLDLLSARFRTHAYAPHTHEDYAIGVVTCGVERIDYRGTAHHAVPGTVAFLEPGEPHTGAATRPEGWEYQVLYPSVALIAEGRSRAPHFPTAIVHDPPLAAALSAAHRALADGTDPLEAHSRLVATLAWGIDRHGDLRPRELPAHGSVVRRISDRLLACLVDPPDLAELAAEAGLSPFHLLRVYRRATGLPPHAWLAQERVGRARRLLESGSRPAEVASAVGFADQAHLTRWFKRVVGVTPGAYRKSVQDPRWPLP